MKNAIAIIFLWLMGLGLMLLSFSLPYYFTQYSMLVLFIGVAFFIMAFGIIISGFG